MTKFISFRYDKTLYSKLENGKKKYGFVNDSDYMRFLIENSEQNSSLINISMKLNELQSNIVTLSNEIQSLKTTKPKIKPNKLERLRRI